MKKLLGAALLAACFCVVGCEPGQNGMESPEGVPPVAAPDGMPEATIEDEAPAPAEEGAVDEAPEAEQTEPNE